jgi:hypothetical protein
MRTFSWPMIGAITNKKITAELIPIKKTMKKTVESGIPAGERALAKEGETNESIQQTRRRPGI